MVAMMATAIALIGRADAQSFSSRGRAVELAKR